MEKVDIKCEQCIHCQVCKFIEEYKKQCEELELSCDCAEINCKHYKWDSDSLSRYYNPQVKLY